MSFRIYLRLRDTCTSKSLWLIFLILTFQLSKGDGKSTVTVRLYPTEKYVASVGERVAFSCLVTGHLREGGPMVHVFWKYLGKTVKSCQFPPTLHRDGFSEYCNYTIVANGTAMQHRYVCTLLYLGTRTKTLLFEIAVPEATIDVRDLFTGSLFDRDSEPICSQLGSTRTFECTVRYAQPGIWDISWIIDGQPVVTGSVETGTGGLVNVSSRFRLPQSSAGFTENLTCQAAGADGQLLNRTVQLKDCLVPDTTVDVRDLLTGNLVDSRPICVQPGFARSFECTVRDAQPGIWGISWIIDGQPVVTGSVETGTRGLVNVSSIINLSGSPTELLGNLTCQGAGVDDRQLLSRTVKFNVCQDSEPASTLNMTILFVVVGVLSGILVTAVAALVLCEKRSRKNDEVRTSAQMTSNVDESVEMESVIGDSGPDGTSPEDEVTCQNTLAQQHAIPDEESKDSGLPSWAQGWGIPWSDFFVDERVLGSGNFGEVRSGAVRKDGEVTRAAIKMLKGYASACDRDDFMDELRMMACIGYHPNIVLLLGACQHHDVLHVALEYLPYGDLRSYLRTARSQSDSDEDALSSEQLVKFALDVAKGMEHLSKAGVIHRDLAARNILLGDRLIAKVSDFGLSRGEDIYVQTSRRRVPLRWLAIESLRNQLYTSQSDVWSFGILLWEIATFGGTPYPSISNDSLAETIKRGYRMPQPDNCHDHIYALMRECWEEEPDARPTFTELVHILSDMADSRIKHTYMAVIRNEYENACAIRPELDDN
ncbi:fibroblast growth factor receptor 1-like [Acanthaster planci]|uniref:receptor protein-tyrosine kinase n=1 Tax=Acanthaster planci TaxID=133434 RepID=A0A8B8A2Y1_ACAPL|nr:fibroblast growth factor receptor 1-like [Acanthaster planci]